MSSSLVRLFLNTLRNYKPMLIPSMYRDTNTYSIVEINDALNKASNIIHSNYQNYDKVSGKENRARSWLFGDVKTASGWATPHMFLKDKV